MTDAPLATQAEYDDERERAVTVLELFFDLVFVLVITQVTGFLAEHLSARGLLEGLLILGLAWWSWVGYAWLTNAVEADDASTRVAFFVAMAGFVVVALATPEAFGRDATAFALAYSVVRVMQVALYARGAGDDAAVRGAILGLAPGFFVGVLLLITGSLLGGDAQVALWGVALLIDTGTPLLRDLSGFHVHPGHFAERHGLILIIALGESIVAIGGGASGHELTLSLVTAAVLAVAAAAAMWWAYFDIVAIVSAHRLSQVQGDERNKLARDSYSYIHGVMVAGIVLLALGLKKTLAHTDGELATIPAIALCGGPALYLAGHIAFRLRNVRTWNRQRVVAAILLTALVVPVRAGLPALLALACVTAVLVALVLYEEIRFGEHRDELKERIAAQHR